MTVILFLTVCLGWCQFPRKLTYKIATMLPIWTNLLISNFHILLCGALLKTLVIVGRGNYQLLLVEHPVFSRSKSTTTFIKCIFLHHLWANGGPSASPALSHPWPQEANSWSVQERDQEKVGACSGKTPYLEDSKAHVLCFPQDWLCRTRQPYHEMKSSSERWFF